LDCNVQEISRNLYDKLEEILIEKFISEEENNENDEDKY